MRLISYRYVDLTDPDGKVHRGVKVPVYPPPEHKPGEVADRMAKERKRYSDRGGVMRKYRMGFDRELD